MKVSKIKSNFIIEDVRFNAGYYLNSDALNSMKLESNKDNCISLEEVANVWNPPIFKRQFCKKTNKSIPYCQSSDVTNQLEGSEVYIYKEQALKVNSVVKKNQILVTGFGTIGNTRLVNELSAGISYANNVCRIEANEKLPFGFIYAFLSSKYGWSQLNKNASGSVVRYIEAPGIKKTLIPILSEKKQQQIHQLISEASKLRVEVNRFLKEAIEIFDEFLDYNEDSRKFQTCSSKIINKNYHKRLDSAFYLNVELPDKELRKEKFNSIPLGDLVKVKMFNAQRGKRNYVEQGGIQFLSTSNIGEKNPLLVNKFLSLKTDGLDSLIVQKDWILVSSSGQDILGSCFIVNETYAGSAVNQHSIRVIVDENKISPFYVYAFLSNLRVKKYLRAGIYGSAVLTINEDFLKQVLIPMLSHDAITEIVELTKKHVECFEEACFKEKEAIDIVEKEIELWQVS